MRRPDRTLKPPSQTDPRLNAFQIVGHVDTPARDDSYADDTHAHFMRPVLRSAPHDKLTSNPIHCNGLRAFATRFSFCLSPPGNGSMFPRRVGFRRLPRSGRQSVATQSLARLVGSRNRVACGFIELAIESRTSDFQSPRHLGHLAAIMRDRETDDFGFHFFERAHLAI